MILIQGLKKDYGNFEVLNVPELELSKGIHWVKGINGSGKSTLLKILAGIISYEGKIQLNKFSLAKDPVAYRARVNYAEAEPLYPDFLTGRELVAFYTKIKKGETYKTDSLLERFGLGAFYQNKIGTYSSGMCKKLSLVLAFIGHPEWILLDEPLVTLDIQSIPILSATINEYHNQGVSFLITSHQSLLIPDLKITSQLLVDNHTVCFQ